MTLAARLCNWLVARGHQADVLILAPQETISPAVRKIFAPEVQFHCVDFKFRLAPWYPLNLGRTLATAFPVLDVIIPLSREGLYVACATYSSLRCRPVVLPYVIDNVAYTTSVKSRIAAAIREHFCSRVPDEFKMFMSVHVKDVHARSLGRTFSTSRILLLPTELRKARPAAMPGKRRIVSIGRIDNCMKKYALHLPGITAALGREGLDVSCDIYGHGEASALAVLEKSIADCGVQERVKVHGELDYARFHEVLEDCFVFVGMGTSAIESAMFGVPTITAVAFSDEAISYGYLPDLPMGVVGEDLGQPSKTRKIFSMISHLCRVSTPEYLGICARHVECAKHYDQETLCESMLRYFEECLAKPYREFGLPARTVVWINTLRGIKYLRRHWTPSSWKVSLPA